MSTEQELPILAYAQKASKRLESAIGVVTKSDDWAPGMNGLVAAVKLDGERRLVIYNHLKEELYIEWVKYSDHFHKNLSKFCRANSVPELLMSIQSEQGWFTDSVVGTDPTMKFKPSGE